MAQSTKTPLNTKRTWTRDGFVISTDASLIPITALTQAFESKQLYWAKGLPEDVMREILDHSLCFGLYTSTSTPQSPPAATTTPGNLIGFARCITDRVTLIYLTDVYILPEHQGRGLGKWLVQCVQEVISDMPHLRRSLLITGSGDTGKRFYGDLMGMQEVSAATGDAVVLSARGPGCSF
jgi:ribosomal protein S18 acetylase RimI-like enzyme